MDKLDLSGFANEDIDAAFKAYVAGEENGLVIPAGEEGEIVEIRLNGLSPSDFAASDILDYTPLPNKPPEGSSSITANLYRGQEVSIDLGHYFSDPDADPLSFSTRALPKGLSLDPDTGLLTGTVKAKKGLFESVLTVDDGHGGVLKSELNFDVSKKLADTSDLLEKNGLLLLSAHLSNAAYRLAPQEIGEFGNKPTTDSQQASFDWVTGKLQLLSPTDLSTIAWNKDSGLPDHTALGYQDGIYHFDNAAALIARSDDALFISFRGTNDEEPGLLHIGQDKEDWTNLPGHAEKFGVLYEEIHKYISAREGTDESIEKIYLTGHSLGGAMVQYAYKDLKERLPGDFEIEGVTFGSPGSFGIDLDDSSTERKAPITQFVNQFDAIRVAEAVYDFWGQRYPISTMSLAIGKLLDIDTFAGPFDSHAMAGYLAIAGAIHETGLDVSGIRGGYVSLPDWLVDWFGAEDRQMRLNVPLQADKVGGSTEFFAGKGDDVIFAGAVETSLAGLSAIDLGKIHKLIESANVIKSGLQFGVNPSVVGFSDFMFSIADTVSDPNNFGKALQKFSKLYTIGLAIIKAADAYHTDDIIVGGPGNDYLNGLGGHDIIHGGADDDHLVGGSGVDVLWGGDGNDTLDGGSDKKFIDTLYGGKGNDTYIVYSKKDVAIETAKDDGWDAIHAHTNWTLTSQIEQLVLHDSNLVPSGEPGLSGTGNSKNNMIIGGVQNNRLNGKDGADYLQGGAGADMLLGGEGKDTFVFTKGDVWQGEIINGQNGQDKLLAFGVVSFLNAKSIRNIEIVKLSAQGDDSKTGAAFLSSHISADIANGLPDNLKIIGDSSAENILKFRIDTTEIFLRDLKFNNWSDSDRIIVQGSEEGDIISATSKNDEVSGGKGSDRVFGFAGDDILSGGQNHDKLTGGKGKDTFVFGNKFGKDTVMDFKDDVDQIQIVTKGLWKGYVPPANVVDTFASVKHGDVVFDFGKDKLTLRGFDDLDALWNDIVFA